MNKTQEEKLNEIIASLAEKGYDPVEQLSAYALIGNSSLDNKISIISLQKQRNRV